MKSDLRPDIHRALLRLDELPAATVITDQYGHAWQNGSRAGDHGYWYRAFDSDSISTWQLAQRVGGFSILDTKEGE